MSLSKDKGKKPRNSAPEGAGPEALAPEPELTKADASRATAAAGTEPTAARETVSEPADLQAQLAQKTKEAEDYRDRLLRTAAEMENLKKRLEREKADLLQFANESLIKELLPVVDNMDLALEHGRQQNAPGPLLEGLELVHQGFLKVLGRFGVTPLESVGQPFNPAFHHAVVEEVDPEAKDCTVIKEIQKGYLLHNRLLRPAMVAVARNPQKNSCQRD